MRLDRINLAPITEDLRHNLRQAMASPGRLVRFVLDTSPSDGVQVFIRSGSGGQVVLAIRRPGGKEDPRELEALARHMGLRIVSGPVLMHGKINRPLIGPRTYLVAWCELDRDLT